MTFQQIAGAALMLAFLGDIFLTVLYARAGTGLLAPYWNRAVWALLSASSTLFGRRRGAVLSLAGPVIVVALIGFWALGLTVGAALIIRPELGTSIRPSSGDTPPISSPRPSLPATACRSSAAATTRRTRQALGSCS